MQSTDIHTSHVELIRSESQRLKEYLNTLPPEALERPSPCEMWDVGEVIAHLEWFAETYGGMMARGLRGDLSPTEGFPESPGKLSGFHGAEVYGQAAIERRRSLGKNLLPAFNERYDWLIEMLKGIGPEDWDKPCYHQVRIRSVESFLATIIIELAVHEWDIRSTLEPSPLLSENSIPTVLERIQGNRGNRPPWSTPFPTNPTSPGPMRFRFELTGAGAKNLDVIVEDNKARLETAEEAPASFSISCDTSTFVLLMWGRISLESAKATGRLTAEGEQSHITDFERWFTLVPPQPPSF